MVLSSWPIATARVHPVHLDECRSARRAAADPPTKPTDLGVESACIWRHDLHPPSPFNYYSARELILILPSHGGWKAESTQHAHNMQPYIILYRTTLHTVSKCGSSLYSAGTIPLWGPSVADRCSASASWRSSSIGTTSPGTLLSRAYSGSSDSWRNGVMVSPNTSMFCFRSITD